MGSSRFRVQTGKNDGHGTGRKIEFGFEFGKIFRESHMLVQIEVNYTC